MYESSLNKLGVLSMKSVAKLALKKVGLFNTFNKNGMFVLTPRIRNSFKERYIFCTVD